MQRVDGFAVAQANSSVHASGAGGPSHKPNYCRQFRRNIVNGRVGVCVGAIVNLHVGVGGFAAHKQATVPHVGRQGQKQFGAIAKNHNARIASLREVNQRLLGVHKFQFKAAVERKYTHGGVASAPQTFIRCETNIHVAIIKKIANTQINIWIGIHL